MSDAVIELAQRGRTVYVKDRERLVDLLLDSLTESPELGSARAHLAQVPFMRLFAA